MEIIGLIAEYNPLHNGHLYHINKIKEKYPGSLLVLVLNGYFLQRGEVSIISKYDKAGLALEYGVDIVVSLPTLYGVQSADTFADISIKLLNYLKVNRIIFGSETNDIDKLTLLAKKSLELDESTDLKQTLKSGINYPTALSIVINESFTYNSNDLLGICYIKSIIKNNFNIKAESIQRTNDYLDTSSYEDIVSASNIRQKIKDNINISKHLPASSKEKICTYDEELLFNLIKISVLNDNISDILDVDINLYNMLKNNIQNVNSMEELLKVLKSKKYTYNKLNRMLIHILLGIKKEYTKEDISYLNIIGLSQNGKKHLNSIKKDIGIPLKPDKNSIIYKLDIKASIIYDMLTSKNEYKKELANKPIIHSITFSKELEEALKEGIIIENEIKSGKRKAYNNVDELIKSITDD